MRFFSVLLLFSVTAAAGVILSTADGGLSWHRESSGSLYSLNAVCMDPLSGNVIAVGDRGTILRRSSEGRWQNVSLPGMEADLRSVATGFDGVCMACGDSGTLISSFDGGESWRVWNEFDSGGVDLLSVNFDPSSSGSFVITGDEGFIFTSSDRYVDSGTETPFIGSCVRLCSTFPEMAVSSSGEVYFTLLDSLLPPDDSFSFNGVTGVVSGGGGFAAAGDEGLICTYVGGSWIERETGCTEDLYDIENILYGINLCSVGSSGTILVSTDDGESWSEVASGVSRNLNGVTGDGSGRGYIVGDSCWGRFFN